MATDAHPDVKSLRVQLLIARNTFLEGQEHTREAYSDIDPPVRWREYEAARTDRTDRIIELFEARVAVYEYAEDFLGDHPTDARIVSLQHDSRFTKLREEVGTAARAARAADDYVRDVLPPLAAWFPDGIDDYELAIRDKLVTFPEFDRYASCAAARIAKVAQRDECIPEPSTPPSAGAMPPAPPGPG